MLVRVMLVKGIIVFFRIIQNLKITTRCEKNAEFLNVK